MKRWLNDHSLPLIVTVYLLAAVVTFGHAWQRVCVVDEGMSEQLRHMHQGMRTLESFACAFAWPLYWSVHAWSCDGGGA